MASKEKRLKQNVEVYFKSLEPSIWYFKVWGSSFQKTGVPDFICCYCGLFIAIELKSPGNKPSKIQHYVLNRIQKSGGIAFVAYDLDTIKQTFVEIRKAFEESGTLILMGDESKKEDIPGGSDE